MEIIKPEFTKEYFINKLTIIPDENWALGDLYDDTNPNRGCLLFHCGVKKDFKATEESLALGELLLSNLEKIKTNDKLLNAILTKFSDDLDDNEKLCIVHIINDSSKMRNKTPKQSILDVLNII